MILSTFVQIKKHTSEVAITHIAMDRSFFFFFFFFFPSSRNAETLILKNQTNKQTKTAGRTRPPAVIRRSLDPNVQRPGL
jgi:hypothetical protein